MSLAALTMVLGHVALFGVVREADEGTAAHVFQLLMVAQVPIVACFAITWLGQYEKIFARARGNAVHLTLTRRGQGARVRGNGGALAWPDVVDPSRSSAILRSRT